MTEFYGVSDEVSCSVTRISAGPCLHLTCHRPIPSYTLSNGYVSVCFR